MILPILVAAASAKRVDLDKTATASALPKLKECPIVPEEVQIPKGVLLAFISKAIFLLNEKGS